MALCDSRLAWTYRDIPAWANLPISLCGGRAGCQMCGHSQDQSPIDLPSFTSTLPENHGSLEIETVDEDQAVELIVNEHTYQMNFNRATSDTVTWNGKAFKLAQFHYHSPSENTLNGEHFDMELHHVNVAADGQILVIAVLGRAQAQAGENEYMAQFWDEVPLHHGDEHGLNMSSPYKSRANFPGQGEYYKWQGSLTTPPCTNDTVWIMMKDPMTVSFEQLDHYRQGINGHECTQLAVSGTKPVGVNADYTWDLALGTNNRPVQALADRVIYRSGTSARFISASQSESSGGSMNKPTIMAGVVVVLLIIAFCVWRSKSKGKDASGREPSEKEPEYLLLAA